MTFPNEQGRGIATCPHCFLHQFRTATSNQCRRCGRALDPNCLVLPLMRERKKTDPVSRLGQIGGRIRHLRIRAGYTQAAFAEVLDTDRSYISRVETARAIPSLARLLRMSEAFKLEPATFFVALFA